MGCVLISGIWIIGGKKCSNFRGMDYKGVGSVFNFREVNYRG